MHTREWFVFLPSFVFLRLLKHILSRISRFSNFQKFLLRVYNQQVGEAEKKGFCQGKYSSSMHAAKGMTVSS